MKPEVILKLEKEFGIELTLLEGGDILSHRYRYKLNNDNKIIGLNMRGNKKIQDTSCLIDFINLEYLDLADNQIQDISSLKSLTNLTSLNISNNLIQNISPLKDLKSLKSLEIRSNKIQDISSLNGLTNLSRLNLSNNRIQDISSLKDLINLSSLDLSNNQIQDISSLNNLINLTILDMRNSKIQDLSFLKDLINLTSLDIGNNEIQDLSFLKNLINLTNLFLRSNRIHDISPLKGLINLISLELSNNQIQNLSFLKDLVNLIRLDIGNNEIQDLSFLKNLINLTNLFLRSNRIHDISPLKGLINLITLDLSNNQIQDISFLEDLINLRSLTMSNNKIAEISSLSNLYELKSLKMKGNEISDIFCIKGLNLYSLHLDNNQINIVPKKMVNFFLSGSNLHKNPIIIPPKDILKRGFYNTIKYYDDLNEEDAIKTRDELKEKYDVNKEDGVRDSDKKNIEVKEGKKLYSTTSPLNEAKLIFIGNGEVGKSSIRTRLMNRNDQLPRISTHGIDIFEWDTKIVKNNNEIDFKFNIWDFGGQGEYRSVQQFFCTRNSIYIYVTSYDDESLNKNDEYVDFDFWYPFVMIYRNSDDKESYSPLIHVRNKTDKKVLPLNEEIYRKLYPKIYPEFLQVDCIENTNINNLESLIKKVVSEISSEVFSEYPKKWMNAKNEFEKMRRQTIDFISRDQFDEICIKNGMDKEAIEIWIKILDSIGTITYFEKISTLRHLVILNPEWLKEAAYRVLKRKDVRSNYGMFKDFTEIWKGNNYPKEMYGDLTELMLAFEICYKGRDERGAPAFFIPALFPKKSENEKNIFQELILDHGIEGENYSFKIKYDLYMPAGLLHKLMIRHSKEIYSRFKWSDSFIIHSRGTFSEVKEDWKRKEITIDIKGKNPGYIYRFITNGLLRIGQELADSKSIMPLSFSVRALYEGDYEKIKSLSKNPLARELYSFLFENKKEELKKISKINKIKKVFVSYSHSDSDAMKELSKFLIGLERNGQIEKWDDLKLESGMEIKKDILYKLEEADIVILLISQDFIASDFIYDHELPLAMKKKLNGSGSIIPVLLSKSTIADLELDIKNAEGNNIKMGDFYFTPQDENNSLKPIKEWEHKENAWIKVYEEVKKKIEIH
jgi:internalin A